MDLTTYMSSVAIGVSMVYVSVNVWNLHRFVHGVDLTIRMSSVSVEIQIYWV